MESTYNGSTNTSDDEMVEADETTWTKEEFGEMRLIFAVLPPPVIVIGVLVNVVLLGLTAARRDGLRHHPIDVYVGGLCVCFAALLVVDSGLQEWISFMTAGPITARAHWLCRGVPFTVGWVRTSACWLTVCALVDRCVALAGALRPPTTDTVVDRPSTRQNEPSTSAAGEVGLLVPAATKKTTYGGSGNGSGAEPETEAEPQQVRRRRLPALCRPIAVMLLTAMVFVTMAFANSPLLIRRWIRLQSTLAPRCVVPYSIYRLCSITSYATTIVPIVNDRRNDRRLRSCRSSPPCCCSSSS